MATLRLFGGGLASCIPNYTLLPGLLFDVVAETPDGELSPHEKLFVVQAIGQEVHAGYLADIYMKCGCFAEARAYYISPEHPRKLGDICWCEGKLDEAEAFYLKPVSAAQFYRGAPDTDRLIKLAFFRRQWDRVVIRFCEGSFSPALYSGQVVIGSSQTSAGSYLEMLAIALQGLGTETPPRALEILESAFGIDREEWQSRVASFANDATVTKLMKRCRPRVGAATSVTLASAAAAGGTARARDVVKYIREADDSLEAAQAELEAYATGDDDSLQRFIQRVTGSGIRSISHSFLFAALGHDSFDRANIPPERLVRLYSSHSIMNKRHFGTVLDLRFQHRIALTADDILTGLFQSLGRITLDDSPKRRGLGDIDDLASCREWARVRLEDWLQGRGEARVEEVAATWREGRAQPVPYYHSFGQGVVRPPDSPRNMEEWHSLMAESLEWLRACWRREIATSPWVSENQLFHILRRRLKGIQVLQHGRPLWLEPQHLDVYLPELGIAVEYMGRQHFEPLEFFGGGRAFEAVVERDKRKAVLCDAHGIELIRVRFDEDVGQRALAIAEYIKLRASSRSAAGDG